MKRTLSETIAAILEYLLLMNFSIFFIFTPFSGKVVKICFPVAVGLWLLINILTYRKKFFKGFIPANPLNLPIVIFLSACILAIFTSVNPYYSQAVFFDRYIMYFLFFWIGMGLVARSRKNSYILAGVFIIWNFIFGVGAVRDYFFYSRIVPDLAERIWSVFGRRIDYYGFPLYLTFFVPFNFLVFILAKNRWLKIACFLNALLLFICLVMNSSRIAWAAVLISMSLFFLVKKRKALLVGLVIVIALLSMSLLAPRMRTRIKTIPFPSEWSNRLPLYKSALAIFRDHPLFGTGIGTFQKVLHEPKYELPPDYPVPKELNLHAHNTYLEIASEMGIVGLLAFIWIFTVFLGLSLHLIVHPVPGSVLNDNERAICLGLTGAIFAILIFAFGSTIITVGPTVSSYFWFLFGMSSGFLTRERGSAAKQS